MLGLRGDVRHELDRARAGADDGHPPSGEVVVVPPGGRVEGRAAELIESGQRWDGGSGELPARRDQHIGLVRAAVGEVEHPAAGGVVEPGGGHLDPEAHPREHFESLGDGLQVRADLRLRRVPAGPVGLGGEGERVQGRRDVARRAGIAVGRPDTADLVGRSRIVTSSTRACARRTAMPMPPKPAPMIVTEGERDANAEPPGLGTRARSRYVEPPSRCTHG